ncbi:MAG TPA: DUF1501 domain-containing protein [Vicinamibacterales bacterium]|nr:DUF1501 domain-containing protein [Vicinamibacterales bacterium]
MTSRRVFLKNGAFALVSLGFAPSFLARTAFAAGGQRRAKQLIAIFQRGAVDGLNMIVPYGESDYYRARPSIAVQRPRSADGALDLDGFFGLNPRMAPLKPFWDARDLAVVHACGSPDATRSHFDAQDYMESGTPGVKSTDEGWLNRYLQARHEQTESTFRAVAISQQLPRMLQGHAPALAINQIAQFGIRAGGASEMMSTGFEAQYAAAADQVLNGVGREAFSAMKTLKGTDPTRYQPANGAQYPNSAFGQALRQIAQLSKSDLGLEIAFADLGGWDTHVNQGNAQGQLATRLDDFSRSIAALVTDLGERMADTLVLTMSEFGRAVNENGNRGTDHGHGNAMIAIGGGVRGGKVYGKWPGLGVSSRYEGRDLAVTTDFRDVFGEVVVRHLGLENPQPIFPGYAISASKFPGLFA